jgi:hypothetical protein
LRVERAQRGEERADRLWVEGEARRKLKQQRAELAAEARHLLEKCIERRVRPRQEGHHFSQRKPRNLAALTQCLRTRSLGQQHG